MLAQFNNMLNCLSLFQFDIVLLALLRNVDSLSLRCFTLRQGIDVWQSEDILFVIHIDEMSHVLFSQDAYDVVLLIFAQDELEQIHVLRS